jgi:hypothetical protein
MIRSTPFNALSFQGVLHPVTRSNELGPTTFLSEEIQLFLGGSLTPS